MVSKLHYFRTFKSFARWVKELGYSERVAKKAWRGSGWYYHRGKGYFVKYSQARDRARGGKVGKGPWRHTHDLTRLIVKLNRRAKRAVRKAVKHIKGRKKKKVAAALILRKAGKRTKHVPATVKKIARYLWDQIPKRYKTGKERKWTYISVLALAKAIHKQIGDRDWKAVDWAHEIDWAQGYYYAKGVVDSLLGANRKYGNLSEREIEMIEKHWEALAKELHLPQTIDPWELKALFE